MMNGKGNPVLAKTGYLDWIEKGIAPHGWTWMHDGVRVLAEAWPDAMPLEIYYDGGPNWSFVVVETPRGLSAVYLPEELRDLAR